MAVKTESDIESDEEFEELLFVSGNSMSTFLCQLRNQISKKPLGSGRQAFVDISQCTASSPAYLLTQ